MKEPPYAVVCHNLHKTFGVGSARVEALRGINMNVKRGELRMLMGPSGCGKTTLISVIAGILTQDEGECLISGINPSQLSNGEKTHFRGKNVGFVFQSFNLIPMLNVEENVAIPLLLNGMQLKDALEQAKDLLNRVGMSDKIGTLPTDLSGGQQQRVAIARAIIHKPLLVVCDEPTSSLDHELGIKIMALMREMATEQRTTLIVVTHDVRIVEFADHIDHLEDGRIV